MIAAKPLSELLTTLLERPSFGWKATASNDIRDGCMRLLAERAETSGLQLAAKIFGEYDTLGDDAKRAFFEFLNEDLDIDADAVVRLANEYRVTPSPETYEALAKASEPARQRLFRRMNEAPGATAAIVRMRQDLRGLLPDQPHLARTDHDLLHLLRSWFNRGFLVMQQISWDSPATILEKIIAYEAVHELSLIHI